MRRVLAAIGIVIVVVIVVVAWFFFWPEPEQSAKASPNQPTGQALIQRGEYLTRAADCVACHKSPDGRQQFAGGRPFKLPFGTIYAPNITPDQQTGIGAWSDADFVRAMHRGVGRNGSMLYPAFPYASYALMSTDDVLAIKAYLFSLPPVKSDVPPPDLGFPYNQSYLLRAWRLLYVPGRPFQADRNKPEPVNRGAYLVQAMGHCGECHTPRTSLYGLDDKRMFAGAVTQGWNAYNISSDKQAGIGAWSDADLAAYLSKGYAEGHGAAAGNMGEAVDDSLHYLTPQDIQAMVAFLRTVPPQQAQSDSQVEAQPPALQQSTAYAPAPAEAKSASMGLQIFQGACASCHGWNGDGMEHAQAALRGSRSVNDPHGTNLLQVVLHGARLDAPGEGASFMPAFGQAYSDTEIAAVSNYVLAHFGGKQGKLTQADVAAARQAAQ